MSTGDRGGSVSDSLSRRWAWALTLTAWLVTRAVVLSQALDFRADEILFRDWAVLIAQGSFPVGDPTYQYPPGAGLLFWGIDQGPFAFHRAFTASVLLADLAVLVLLLTAVARRRGSWQGPWAWIVGGFLAGGLLYERFDIFPTLLAVISLLLIQRPVAMGAVAGLGAMVKVWPALTILAVPRRDLPRALLGLVGGALVVWAAAALVAANATSFVTNQASRGLQIEAVAALPVLGLSFTGVIDAPSIDRFGSTELDTALAEPIAWISLLLGFALIALLLVERLRGRLEHVPGADVVVAAVLVFVAFNRVNSPQFFTWIAGVGAVALLSGRSRMLAPLTLAALSMVPLVDFIGPNYGLLQAQDPTVVAYQGLRASLLLAAAVSSWVIVMQSARRQELLTHDGP